MIEVIPSRIELSFPKVIVYFNRTIDLRAEGALKDKELKQQTEATSMWARTAKVLENELASMHHNYTRKIVSKIIRLARKETQIDLKQSTQLSVRVCDGTLFEITLTLLLSFYILRCVLGQHEAGTLPKALADGTIDFRSPQQRQRQVLRIENQRTENGNQTIQRKIQSN